jgi:hypothetical protein
MTSPCEFASELVGMCGKGIGQNEEKTRWLVLALQKRVTASALMESVGPFYPLNESIFDLVKSAPANTTSEIESNEARDDSIVLSASNKPRSLSRSMKAFEKAELPE